MKWGRRLFFVNRHSSVVFLVFLFVSLHARGYTWTDLPAKLSAVITDNGMTVDTIEAVSSITLLVPVGTRMAHIYVQRDTSINLGEDYEYMHGYCGYGYPWTFCRDKCCTHGLEGLDVDGCVEDHSSYAWSVLENGELEYLYGGMLTLESTMVESRKTDHRLLPGVHPFTMGFFHTWCIHKVDRPETCLRLDHAMGEATGTVTVVRMDTMEGPLDFKISDVRSWEDGWAEEHAGDQEPDSPRWLSLPIDEKCSTATFTAAPWPEGTWPLYEPNWNLWSGNGSLLVNPSDRATAHLSTDVPLSGSLRVSCGTSYLETTVYVVEVAGIQAVRLGRSDKPRDYWDGVYRIENWYSWQPFSGESGWENESGDGRFVVTEWGNGTMSCLAFPNPKLGTTLAEAAERLPDDWRFTGGADGGGGEGEGGEGEGGEGEGGEGGEGGEEEEEEEPEEVEIEPDGHDPEHRMIQNVDLALPGSYDLVAECGISRKALTIHVCGVCITPEAEEANVPDSFTPSWPPAPSAGTSAPFRNMEKKVAIRRNIAWDGAMSACIPVRLSPKNLAVLENLRYRDMGGQLQENTGRMELEASGQHFAIYDSPDALLPSTTLDNLPLGTDSIKYVRLAPAFFQGKSKTMTLTLRYTSSLAVFTDTLTIVATSCAPEMQSEGYVLVNDDNDDMGDFDANPSFPADVTADKNQTGELNEADDELMRIFFPKPPADTPGDDGSTGGGGDVTGVSVTVVGGNARLWRSAKKERTVQDSNTALLFSATECTGGCAVYVEGLSKGTDTVTATWTVGGRTVTATQPITILELRMIVDGCHPDANRSDMKFDDFGKEDSNHNKIMEDFGNYQSVFWVNDDCDYHNLVKFHVGLPYWCEQDVAPTLTTVTAPPGHDGGQSSGMTSGTTASEAGRPASAARTTASGTSRTSTACTSWPIRPSKTWLTRGRRRYPWSSTA